ncbi:uroporphyrinogen-III synthase [Vannielia litorea]|uniref:Uroporphyrinogen-III synthase n=1 Tax=Vannielia litorea TaxID=1217970 RepID=A0A1N6HLK6_9RHOB|nr:uroporphyrinogen-III synthase [Vannielia litorea]SIO20616.1 uroporphyrinogen-III synthase [Vannielia litorea]
MNRLPVLLTRPQRGNAEFGKALRETLGEVEIIENPLMEIVPLRPEALPGPEDAVIFTSVNGVEVCSAWQAGAGRRAWCVGARTAEAAQAAGFDAVAGGGTVQELPGLIHRAPPTGLLWHLHGVHRRGNLAAALAELGHGCRSEAIYDQRALPLSTAVAARIGSGAPIVVPLFSPRTAGLLAAEVKNLGANLRVVALSGAVAAEWPGAAVVADSPDAAAMLEAVCREVG